MKEILHGGKGESECRKTVETLSQ